MFILITILKPKNKQIKNFLIKQKIQNKKYIDSPYLIKIEDFNEEIIENVLTGEVISQSLPFKKEDDIYLIENWYKIPEKFNIYLFFKNVIQKNLSKSYLNKNNNKLLESFESIVIFTTLGCNANCYYCYEKKERDNKIKLTKENADKIINQIIKNKPKKLSIHWFGGEPLFNIDIIDYITDKLKENNIKYYSSMISNGLLFNENNIFKAKKIWNLKNVQITIDGTENNYELIKEVPKGSFNKLLNNIEMLLKNNIKVSIRLNLSDKNYKDLKKVIYLLYQKFKNFFSKKMITINTHELFGYEYKKYIYDDLLKLELYIDSLININNFNRMNWKESSCMVDNGKAITFLPNGDISLCEHNINIDIFTNINKDFYNLDIINEYAEQYDNKKCRFCPLRPGCIFSKKCPANGGHNCNENRVKYFIYLKKKNLALLAKKQRKRRIHLMITRNLYTNLDIYNKAMALVEAFNTKEGKELNYPVKINYYLQKNIKAFVDAATEIEEKRIEIVQKYGNKKENSEEYIIPEEKMDEAGKELQDFFELEQEIPVSMLKLDWFDNIDMTAEQVSAISFMIEEEE